MRTPARLRPLRSFPLTLALLSAMVLMLLTMPNDSQAQSLESRVVGERVRSALPQQAARAEARTKKLGLLLGPCLAGSDGDLPCFYLGADLTFYRSTSRYGFAPADVPSLAPRYFRRANGGGGGGRATLAYDTDIWSDPDCPPCRGSLAKASVTEHGNVLLRHSGTVLALVDAVYFLGIGDRGTLGIEPFIGGGAAYIVDRDDDAFLLHDGFDGPPPSTTEVGVSSDNPLPVVTYGAELTLPSILVRDLALRVQLRGLTLFTDNVTYTAYTADGPVALDSETGTLTRMKVLFGLAARF